MGRQIRRYAVSSGRMTALAMGLWPWMAQSQPLDQVPASEASMIAFAFFSILGASAFGWLWWRTLRQRDHAMAQLQRLQHVDTRHDLVAADLRSADEERDATQRFVQDLQQMSELLQVSDSEAQAVRIISQSGSKLFPDWSGALALGGSNRQTEAIDLMEVVAQWGRFPGPAVYHVSACRCLESKQRHQAGKAAPGQPVCAHFSAHAALRLGGHAHSLCVPIQLGEEPGALHLITSAMTHADTLRIVAWRADTFANALKLALDGLRVRLALRDQAVRDALTGLYNRRYFDEALEHEISRARRTGDTLTLALLDIDHFKRFNDTFGHEAGDEVLKAVAGQLQTFVRAYDIACRVGGEELAVLLPRASLQETCDRLDMLREQIANCSVSFANMLLPTITVSIGIADSSHEPLNDMVRRADLALYAAKHAGRNRICCWEPSIEAGSVFGAFNEAPHVFSEEE
jgi:diguanylate cyclase (GGDEF)-like protein